MAASQILAVSPTAVETTSAPSGENATVVTTSECPAKDAIPWPVAASQTSPLRVDAVILVETWEKTPPPCPLTEGDAFPEVAARLMWSTVVRVIEIVPLVVS